MIKPGFKTSEFWIAVSSQIVGLLIMSGHVTPEDGVALNNNFNTAIDAIINFITAMYMLYTTIEYIRGRSKLKQQQLQQATPVTFTTTTNSPNTQVVLPPQNTL